MVVYHAGHNHTILGIQPQVEVSFGHGIAFGYACYLVVFKGYAAFKAPPLVHNRCAVNKGFHSFVGCAKSFGVGAGAA